VLHAVGFGTIWDAKNLLAGGTVNSSFAGVRRAGAASTTGAASARTRFRWRTT
jgi:hypothetical protein